jgi:hypothetical protein
MTGSELIAEERKRQIEVEGYTSYHDDQYEAGELTGAARSYAHEAQLQVCNIKSNEFPPISWPDWVWKPSDDPVRNLVKAGALIAAEIDRIQRENGCS